MVAGPGSRYAGRMPNIGPWEIILLLLLALLLFGAKRLPEIGRSVGQGASAYGGAPRVACEGCRGPIHTICYIAPIAQLDRASAYEAEGWGFDSLWAHQVAL